MQVRDLLAVLTPVNASAWIARAQEITLRRLDDEIQWAIRRADESGLDAAVLPPERDADLRLNDLFARCAKPDRQMCATGSGAMGLPGSSADRQMCAVGIGAVGLPGSGTDRQMCAAGSETAESPTPGAERQMCVGGTPPAGLPGPGADRQMCVGGRERFGILGRIHVTILAPASVATMFRHVLQSFAAPQEDRWLAFERMLEQVLADWKARPRHRDPVFARDGYRCTAPGCSSFDNLHDHHIIRRSAGGSNDMHNRTTLCAWHHLRAVHGGLARTSGRAPHALDWELGIAGREKPLLRLRGDRYLEKR